MSEIRRISNMVEQILKDVPETRDDDFKLISCLVTRYYPSASNVSLAEMGNSGIYIPSFESIRRSRQKLQVENEDLRGTIPCRQRRKLKEDEYKEYAINGNR